MNEPSKPTKRSRRIPGSIGGLFAAVMLGALLGAIPATAEVSTGDKPVTITTTPQRILDTRGAPFGPIGVATAAKLGPKQTLTVKVAGAAPVPADAVAVVVNVTAVNSTADSFLTLYPADAARPNASTVNPAVGQIVFNAAVVDLSASGEMSIFNNSGSTDVVIDVTGYTESHNHDDRYVRKNDPGLNTIEVIEGDEEVQTLNSGNTLTVIVTCPDGSEPIAGGINYRPEQHIKVTDNHPTTVTVPGPSWITRLYNDSGAARDVAATGYATCVG